MHELIAYGVFEVLNSEQCLKILQSFLLTGAGLGALFGKQWTEVFKYLCLDAEYAKTFVVPTDGQYICV